MFLRVILYRASKQVKAPAYSAEKRCKFIDTFFTAITILKQMFNIFFLDSEMSRLDEPS
jgi:hypothetical protein